MKMDGILSFWRSSTEVDDPIVNILTIEKSEGKEWKWTVNKILTLMRMLYNCMVKEYPIFDFTFHLRTV